MIDKVKTPFIFCKFMPFYEIHISMYLQLLNLKTSSQMYDSGNIWNDSEGKFVAKLTKAVKSDLDSKAKSGTSSIGEFL